MGLVLAVVMLLVLATVFHCRRVKKRVEEEVAVKLREAQERRSALIRGTSRPTGASQGKKPPGTGDNFSNRHNTMPQHPAQKGGTGTFSLVGPSPVASTSYPAVQHSVFPPTGISQGRSTFTGKGTGNNYSNRHNTMPQHPPPNAGSTPYSPVTGQFPATNFPGTHQSTTPTTVIPMTPITSIPQQPQHQTYQDQVQALQFSSHPRPNYVTTGYSTEAGSSNPSVSYAESSGAPQAAWQPTPFVPPALPAKSTGLSIPSASTNAGADGHYPSTSTATAISSTTGTADLQTKAVRNPQDRGAPSPSSPPPSPSLPPPSFSLLPPSVPRSTRPDQEAGSASSPHALLVRSQNPQQVDDYHLH